MLAISTAHPTACAPGGLRLSRYGRWATAVPAGRSERGDAREEMAPVRRLAPLHESPSLLRAVLRLRRAPPLHPASAILAVASSRGADGGCGAHVQPSLPWCRLSDEAYRHLGHRGQPYPHLPLRRAPPAHRVARSVVFQWEFIFVSHYVHMYSCRLRLILGPYALERVQLGFSGVNGGHNRSQ